MGCSYVFLFLRIFTVLFFDVVNQSHGEPESLEFKDIIYMTELLKGSEIDWTTIKRYNVSTQ